jgi:hypothetical protein
MEANNPSVDRGKSERLVIGAGQMAKFDEASLREFEDKMWVMLQKFFPRHCAKFGEEQTRAIVRAGIEVAAEYDIVIEAHVAEFIALMHRAGLEFDVDPAKPWAGEILRDESLSAAEKLNRIAERLDREAGVSKTKR